MINSNASFLWLLFEVFFVRFNGFILNSSIREINLNLLLDARTDHM